MTTLARVRLADGSVTPALIEEGRVTALAAGTLAEALHTGDRATTGQEIALSEVTLLAPVDQQDVWAAGVTYRRSAVARMEESERAADHYDLVYEADRPELFFKSTAARVVGPGKPVRVRADSGWSVPEPELTLMISPAGEIVGYTAGNDMSARDIEGENPLYLPQAKTYKQSCAVGPVVAVGPPDLANVSIRLTIRRGGSVAFEDSIGADQIHRKLEDLVNWLFRDNDFPYGAVLLTGTGIIPPDQFTLEDGDTVSITITGAGTLENPVVRG